MYYLPALDEKNSVVTNVQDYFEGAIWATPATFAQVPLQNWAFAIGDKPLTISVSLLQLVLSVSLGYGLAFPAGLGIKGLGYAQSIRTWIGFLLYLTAMRCRCPYRDYPLFSWKKGQSKIFKTIWKNGWPVAILNATEFF